MQLILWFRRAAGWIAAILVGPKVPRLPRDQIVEALDQTVAQSKTSNYRAAVLVAQLDDFVRMERTIEDGVLAKVIEKAEARLIEGPCRRHMLRRLSEGKFAVIPTPLWPVRPIDLEKLAEAIQATISQEIKAFDDTFFLSMSVGFATQDQFQDPTGRQILDAARMAERAATLESAASIRAYDADLQSSQIARGAQRKSINRAFATGAIHPFFQPQISLETYDVTGFEALARWVHPDKGMISPAEFLPQLEDLGMMPQLGFKMLDHALAALRSWRDSGFDVPTVSVNFSSEELRNPNLPDYVTVSLAKFDIAPESLVVEVLETVVAEQRRDDIQNNLDALSQMGCVIDLDDFGTGNASINAIRRFGVDRIKIDRSFVSECDKDSDKQSMIEMIVAMSGSMSIGTLAEGAESEAELAFLRRTECQSAQGFGIAPPLAPGDVLAWLKDRRRSAQAIGV